jgi:Ca2+-binding RTX toxin-like protein
MRRSVLLLASVAVAMLLASGVALAASVQCDGGRCKGTPKRDLMIGTDVRDVMFGLGGNDRMRGMAGNDDLFGFDGGDTLVGRDGDDELGGGDGPDQAYGGTGSDVINGGNSADYFQGNDGGDRILGGPDASSDEFLTISGDGGADLLDGGGGADTYDFQVTLDAREAGWGDITIRDSDTDPLPGQDVSGGDRLTFLFWERGLAVVLTPGPGPEATDGVGTIEWSSPGEIHAVLGGFAADALTGDDWANRLMGNSGADTIEGGGGDDTLYESTANNVAVNSADSEPDTIDCGEGTDTVFYDPTRDTVTNCEVMNP